MQGVSAPQPCWLLLLIWHTALGISCVRTRTSECPIPKVFLWTKGTSGSPTFPILAVDLEVPGQLRLYFPSSPTPAFIRGTLLGKSLGIRNSPLGFILRQTLLLPTAFGEWAGAGQLAQTIQIKSLINCPNCPQGPLPL